jgi:carboxyl-terminal processing protease
MEPENNHRKVSIGTYILSLIIVLFVGIGGTYAGIQAISSDEAPTEDTASTTNEEDTNTGNEADGLSNPELSSIEDLYQILMTQYFEEVDSSLLIEGALEGMADAIGDPYTEYLDEVEATSMDEDIQGSFEGIGAEVMKEGEFVRIISPIAGSPAEAAGLLPNDYIVEVDGESVADLALNEAVALIRGPEGSEVELLIQRGDSQFTLSIVRDSIPVESVLYEVDENDASIGHVQITNFNMPTYDELVEALEALEEQGVEKVIFDVRGNPGGLLNIALEISNIFVPDGEPLMQSQGRDEEPITYYANSEEYGEYKFEGEAVLLIDEGSASASEILAGAMQSVDIPLIGTNTFGKGTIQSILPVSQDGEIKFTNGRWLTANGEWIDGEGIAPDMEVEMPEYQSLLIINPDETYQEGDVSDEVENIHGILEALGYDIGDGGNVYGEATVAAVEQFQSENDLEVNGIVSGATSSTLIDELRELIAENDTQYDAAVEYLQER